MKPTIGILAGMGPKSTAPFIEQIIEQCQKMYGARFDIDFPPMMIYSLPTPFYIDRPINHRAMKQALRSGLKKLEKSGVSFITIPCNVVHQYFDDLTSYVKVPLLNIVEETLTVLPKKISPITVLATTQTMETKVYQNAIKDVGKEFVFLKEWQGSITQLIQGVKSGKKQTELQKTAHDLLRSIERENIAGVVVACTDLSKLFGNLKTKLVLVDSSEALAISTVKQYFSLLSKQS